MAPGPCRSAQCAPSALQHSCAPSFRAFACCWFLAAPHHAEGPLAPSTSRLPPSEDVARAMLAVPRGAFVPVDYRDEAYVDAPIRVEAEDFNISAPHM
jgi:hypothetical protein